MEQTAECTHDWSYGWINRESGQAISRTQVCLNRCGARQTLPVGEEQKSVRTIAERKADRARTEGR